MIRPGKKIIIESISGKDNLEFISGIEKILSLNKSHTKVFTSIEQYDDVLVNLLSRIESSVDIEMDIVSNLYLYNAAFTRISEKINAYTNAGINCLISNTYLKLLSNIHSFGYNSTKSNQLSSIVINASKNFNPDLVIILTDSLSKDEPKKQFYLSLSNSVNLLFINTTNSFTKNLKLIEKQLLHSNKKSALPSNQSNNILSLDINYKKQISGFQISIPMFYKQLTKQLSLDYSLIIPEPMFIIQYFNQISALSNFYLSLNLHNINTISPSPVINFNVSEVDSKFVVPKNSTIVFKTKYLQLINEIYGSYTKLFNKFKGHPKVGNLYKMLPLSLKTNLLTRINESDITNLITELSLVDLPEMNQIVHDLNISDHEFTGMKTINPPNILLNLANNLYGKKYDSIDNLETKLIDFYPKNEFSIINGYMYKYSGLDFEKTSQIVTKLNFDQKTNILKNYIEKYPNNTTADDGFFIFETYLSIYSLDFLVRFLGLSSVFVQSLSPRYGYHLPDFIVDRQDIEEFQNAFDTSLSLQKLLSEHFKDESTQYGLLYGNLVRTKLRFNSVQLNKLLNSDKLSNDTELDSFKEEIKKLIQQNISTSMFNK